MPRRDIPERLADLRQRPKVPVRLQQLLEAGALIGPCLPLTRCTRERIEAPTIGRDQHQYRPHLASAHDRNCEHAEPATFGEVRVPRLQRRIGEGIVADHQLSPVPGLAHDGCGLPIRRFRRCRSNLISVLAGQRQHVECVRLAGLVGHSNRI